MLPILLLILVLVLSHRLLQRIDGLLTIQELCLLFRCVVIVHQRPCGGICAVFNEKLDGRHFIARGRPVQGCVTVMSILLNIGAIRDQQLNNIKSVIPVGGQGRDEGWKTGMVAIVGVSAQVEEGADKSKRTVVDGVFQNDLAYSPRSTAVGKIRRISQQVLDPLQISVDVGLVQLAEIEKDITRSIPGQPAFQFTVGGCQLNKKRRPFRAAM